MTLQRRTPLKRTGGPKRTAMKRSRTPVNAKSAKKQGTDQAYVDATTVVKARSGGLCELRTPKCTRIAQDHPHHLLLRSQGGNSHDPALMADVCPECHHEAHHAGETAYANGWLIRSWQVSPPPT